MEVVLEKSAKQMVDLSATFDSHKMPPGFADPPSYGISVCTAPGDQINPAHGRHHVCDVRELAALPKHLSQSLPYPPQKSCFDDKIFVEINQSTLVFVYLYYPCWGI